MIALKCFVQNVADARSLSFFSITTAKTCNKNSEKVICHRAFFRNSIEIPVEMIVLLNIT